MDIYFLRHASAGQHTANLKSDEKRPIDKLGVQQSHDVGRALAALKVDIDVAISSSLARALQTAEIVLDELGYKQKLGTDDALRPEAGYEQFQDLLGRHAKQKAIMLIGHNPSMTDFLTQLLAGSSAGDFIDFKKGAVAKVETDGDHATLKWCMTPKMAQALQSAKTKKKPVTSNKKR